MPVRFACGSPHWQAHLLKQSWLTQRKISSPSETTSLFFFGTRKPLLVQCRSKKYHVWIYKIVKTLLDFFSGHKIVPASGLDQLMTLGVGLLGSLAILGCFASVSFMPVGDATTLMFTVPVFTILFAAVFLRQGLNVIKVVSGMQTISQQCISLVFLVNNW